MPKVACLALSTLFCAATVFPAMAEPADLTRVSAGYTYYNQPGATLKQHDSDLRDCVRTNIGLTELQSAPAQAGVLPAMVSAMIASSAQWQRVRIAAQDCMVARGWRVVRVPDDEGAVLARLDPTALTDKLAPWIGAASPHGEIAFRWGNDGAKLGSAKAPQLNMSPLEGGKSLSLGSLGGVRADDPDARTRVQEEMKETLGSGKVKPLRAEEIDPALAGAGVIVLTLRSQDPSRVPMGLILQRMGPDSASPARKDGKLAELWPSVFQKGKAGEMVERTFVYAVPPGRWRVRSIGVGNAVDFCEGAPFFKVDVGEVAYLGAFDYSADTFKPDMALDPAKKLLATSPIALQRLRPADWINGGVSQCSILSFPYALEFPGVPFAKEYRWGSRALQGTSGS